VSRLSGNPFFEFGPRPIREARLRAYIVRQHRRGRPLSEVLADPYVARCGNERFCWSVVRDPRTIEALRRNDAHAIERASAALRRGEVRTDR
jgi:hypothetical protein